MDARRRQILEDMGITVWTLRTGVPADPVPAVSPDRREKRKRPSPSSEPREHDLAPSGAALDASVDIAQSGGIDPSGSLGRRRFQVASVDHGTDLIEEKTRVTTLQGIVKPSDLVCLGDAEGSTTTICREAFNGLQFPSERLCCGRKSA